MDNQKLDNLTGQVDDLHLASTSAGEPKNTEGDSSNKRKLSDHASEQQPASKTQKKLVPAHLEDSFKIIRRLLEKAGRYNQHLTFLNKLRIYLAIQTTSPLSLVVSIEKLTGLSHSKL